MSPKTRVCFSSPSLRKQERNTIVAITFSPAIASGLSTAGSVVVAAAPIAAIATGIGFLVQGFKPKPTRYQQAKGIAEDIATFGGSVDIVFKILDGVLDRVYPERKAAMQKADPAVKMAEILDRMDARQAKLETELAAAKAVETTVNVDARIKAAVAEAIAAHEAAKAAAEPPAVEQKPTIGKYIDTKKVAKTGTDK